MVPREHPSTYRFADFELDVRACRLTRGGQPVKLEPKAFDVLLCLLRRGGDIASRRDLVAEACRCETSRGTLPRTTSPTASPRGSATASRRWVFSA